MRRIEDFHYADVPRLGTVLISPEAVQHLIEGDVTLGQLERVLEQGTDRKAFLKPYSGSREYNGVRLLFKTRRHMKGAAAVCIDGYRVKP